MSRMSPEARGAVSHGAGSRLPHAPKWLGADEAQLWREIIRSKPLGWFDPSSLHLLGQYCAVLAAAQRAAVRVAEVDGPFMSERIKDLVRLNGNCTTLATKLRLTVQTTVDRKSGMLTEKNDEKAEDKLLGGKAVWAGAKLRAVS